MKFYDRLALFRKNMDYGEYLKLKDILCQLYDTAEENQQNPGELPKKFFLSKVTISKADLKNLYNAIGITASTKVVNSGGLYGSIYQVDLL